MDLCFFHALSPVDKGSHGNKLAACYSGMNMGFGIGYICICIFTVALTSDTLDDLLILPKSLFPHLQNGNNCSTYLRIIMSL